MGYMPQRVHEPDAVPIPKLAAYRGESPASRRYSMRTGGQRGHNSVTAGETAIQGTITLTAGKTANSERVAETCEACGPCADT